MLEVDVKRKRVALSMRLDEAVGAREGRPAGGGAPRPPRRDAPPREPPRADGVMADALARAFKR